jgi:hypothetical protein
LINTESIFVSTGDGGHISVADIELSTGLKLTLAAEIEFSIVDIKLSPNTNQLLDISLETLPFGEIRLSIEDHINKAIDNSKNCHLVQLMT